MWTDALRSLREVLPGAELIQDDAPGGELAAGAYEEKPCTRAVRLVEGTALRAIPVPGAPEVRFAGFLDGIQRVRIPTHHHGVPIVLAMTGAAVRVRRGRRMVAWGHMEPVMRWRIYIPWGCMDERPRERAGRFEIVDTTPPGADGGVHPAALYAIALERVGADREELEVMLAERWCATEGEPLLVDGSITASRAVAAAPAAVGVVKSHTTLHATGSGIRTVLGLARGERTPVFVVERGGRGAVDSWYLRVRDPRGHDPMFGLVRVEVAHGERDVGRRADEVSRWILGEGSPLALPDARWDRMVYGIRDCEEFLRAVAQ